MQTAMASPTTTQIPLDILYDILNHFHIVDAADRAALDACSRVCRVWLPIAQSHLFTLRTHRYQTTDDDELSALKDSAPRAFRATIVTHLRISFRSHDQYLPLVSLFPRLKRLFLHSRTRLDEPLPFPPPPPVPIDFLTLDRYHASMQLYDALLRFSSVNTLILRTINNCHDFRFGQSHLPVEIPEHICPKYLSISPISEELPPLLDAFSRTQTTATLQVLHCELIALEKTLPAIVRFIRSLQQLSTLKLQFSQAYSDRVAIEGRMSRSNQRRYVDKCCGVVTDHLAPAFADIRTLHTVVIHPPNKPSSNPAWLPCFAIFDSLPPTLQRLHIHMKATDLTFQFSATLRRLTALKELLVVVTGLRQPVDMKEFVAWLAGLYKMVYPGGVVGAVKLKVRVPLSVLRGEYHCIDMIVCSSDGSSQMWLTPCPHTPLYLRRSMTRFCSEIE